MSISNFLDPTKAGETWKHLYINSMTLPNNSTTDSKSSFDYYEYYDHLTTWGGTLITTTAVTTALRITRIGNVVTIRLPQFTGTGNGANGIMQMTTVLPSRFRPASTEYFPCPWLKINSPPLPPFTYLGTSSNILIRISNDGQIAYVNAFDTNFTGNVQENGLAERVNITYTIA